MKLQKTANITDVIKNNRQISFGGYKDDYNAKGQEGYTFYAPPYDRSKYNLSFEFVRLVRDRDGWVVSSDFKKDGAEAVPMKEGKPFFVSKQFPLVQESDNRNKTDGSVPDKAFGYRYKLTEKEDASKALYVNDAGLLSETDGKSKFNVLLLSTGGITKQGPMYHIFPDAYHNKNWDKNPQKELELRTHFNVAGGNIEGMIDKVKNTNEIDPYGLIISTPLFGKDELSSHGYWTTNPYQVSNLKGDLDLFKQFNVELFKKGKQYVADGAFTSQGYQSPFLQHALKWGKKSPYFNWFKFDFAGNNYNPQIALGVLPDSEEAKNNTSYKLVNSPNQPDYNRKKPTYIQFYDKRLASAKQITDTKELIKTYDKKLPKDTYDISNHQDSVLPYSFEIDANQSRQIKDLQNNAGKSISEIKGYEELFTFENFKIAHKEQNSGANFWDGNLDLVKMNLSNPNITPENILGNVQAKNHLFNVASYWTKTVNDAFINELVGDMSKAEAIAKANGIDKTAFDMIESAVQSGNYQNNLFKEDMPTEKFILNEIMEFPLESIEVNPNLSAVLGSPYITPNATTPEQSNSKKIDLLSDNTTLSRGMKEIYSNNIAGFVKSVLEKMDTDSSADKKIFADGELSEYGKFITRMITPELVKYAIVKGLFGESDIKLTEKGIGFNTESLGKKGIYELGIIFDKQYGAQGEAAKICSKIGNNTRNLSEKADQLAQIYNKKFAKADVKAFKLAQAIIENSGAGLNWRFDAAKDVADLSNVRSNQEVSTFKDAMDDMIDFWTPFVANIKKENPHSLSVAEITSLWDFYRYPEIKEEDKPRETQIKREFNSREFGEYLDPGVAERIFYERTGATTGSNYSQFFNMFPQLFGKHIEHGYLHGKISAGVGADGKSESLRKKLLEFINSGQLAFIKNNHIFVDNHDKPRVLHGMAIDMKLFLSEFNNDETRKTGKEVMGDDVDLDKISSKGVAVAKVFKEHFPKFASKYGFDAEKVNKAILELASGKISSEDEPNKARSRAFGSRPLEITIKDIIKRANINLEPEAQEKLEQKVLESIMDKPMQSFASMWEVMNATIGVPTMFNGEEYGQTGHETSSKNQELGCRNIVLHNRKEGHGKFSDLYKHIWSTSNLHNEKGLSALSCGTPILLDQGEHNAELAAVYKYDNKGSEVLSVITINGVDRNNGGITEGVTYDLSKGIQLVSDKNIGGNNAQLKPGTEFKRKIYDESSKKHIDEPKTYVVNEDGTRLVDKNGNNVKIFPGANVFYKTSGSVSFMGNAQVKLHNTKYAIPAYN